MEIEKIKLRKVPNGSMTEEFEIEFAHRANEAAETLKYIFYNDIHALTLAEMLAEAIKLLREAVVELKLNHSNIPIEHYSIKDLVKLLKVGG